MTEPAADPDVTAGSFDGWPVEKRAFLTLDLECDYGTAVRSNSFEAVNRMPALTELLEKYDVPLTCFLQTELLEEVPEAVVTLENARVPVEFHPHSHTHDRRDRADRADEVTTSVERIRDRFGTNPLGYRFPDGAARATDYAILGNEDVAFSASLFPSWRPGRFNNLDSPRYPFSHAPTGIWELPFTVYSDRIRIPVALSYLKLLGRPFERLVLRRPPNVVLFDMHMHDLVVPSTFDRLPAPYRAVYARRKHEGVGILDRLIDRLLAQGYTFGRLSELYAAVERAASTGARPRDAPGTTT